MSIVQFLFRRNFLVGRKFSEQKFDVSSAKHYETDTKVFE